MTREMVLLITSAICHVYVSTFYVSAVLQMTCVAEISFSTVLQQIIFVSFVLPAKFFHCI